MPLPTLACTITSAGITAPTYAQIRQSLTESFQSIFGSDAYLAPDSQDGQWIAILAKAIDDSNQQTIACYHAFSPTFGQGAVLSALVKINGLRRLIPTHSTAVGNVVGVSGTVIENASVRDDNGNVWDLPATVTIPIGGTIAVTVTARDAGALNAATGTINAINTPTRGWQSFTSTANAVPGQPVETDAALRRRQSISTGLPAISPLASLRAAIANIIGVTRVLVYENDTGAPNADGLPAHSIAPVVAGGTVQEIVDAIGLTKTPGAATFGTTTGSFIDPQTGVTYSINYSALTLDQIDVVVDITKLDGYDDSVADMIKSALVDYLNGLDIGQDVIYTRLFPTVLLFGDPLSSTFEVTGLHIAKHGNPPGVIDLVIAFNKAAAGTLANMTVNAI